MALIGKPAIAAIGLLALAGFYTGAAAALPCGPLPKVAWWGTNNHASMTAYVARKHGGSWAGYIAKWEKYRSHMEDVLSRGGAVAVKKEGIRLEGPRLAECAQNFGRRVSVIRCLAKEAAGRSTPVRRTRAYGAPQSEVIVIGASRGDTVRRPDPAQCPALPDISWWGTNSHRKMVDFVERKFDGDWGPYIAKWERYEARMRDILKRGGTAVLRKKGIKMDGAVLASYAEMIGQRVSVMYCLADAGSRPAQSVPWRPASGQ